MQEGLEVRILWVIRNLPSVDHFVGNSMTTNPSEGMGFLGVKAISICEVEKVVEVCAVSEQAKFLLHILLL